MKISFHLSWCFLLHFQGFYSANSITLQWWVYNSYCMGTLLLFQREITQKTFLIEPCESHRVNFDVYFVVSSEYSFFADRFGFFLKHDYFPHFLSVCQKLMTFHPHDTKLTMRDNVSNYKRLQSTIWTGWIILSSQTWLKMMILLYVVKHFEFNSFTLKNK